MMENIIRFLVRRVVAHMAESKVENGKKSKGMYLLTIAHRSRTTAESWCQGNLNARK